MAFGLGKLGYLGRLGGAGIPAWPTGTPFESNGSSSPWFQTPIGPNAVYDSANGKAWLAWERGIASDNKRVVSVATYHPSDTTWSADYVAATNTLTGDVHGAPAIAISAGYAYLFYGAHTSTMHVASTANTNDPSIWYDQPDIAGSTHTFPNPIGDASKIYLLDNIPSVAVGGGVQAAIEMLVGTPSAGTISWAASKMLIDGGDGSHLGWIPVCQARENLAGTEIHFVFPYAITIAETITGIYYARYVKATGAVVNFDGSHSVAAASQPINAADMNTYFKIASPTDGGFPALAIDANGSHVTYADGNLSLNAVLKYILGSGGTWSSPLTIFTYPTTTDPTNVDAGIVPNSASGVDVYYADAAAGYTFPGSNGAVAGNIYSVTRSSSGVWGGAKKIAKMGTQGLDFPAPVYNGPASARVVFTEVTSDYTAMSGALKGYAYGDSGYVNRPAIINSGAATNFLNRTSGLDAAHTAAYYELINGLVTDGVFSLLDALHILATADATTAKLNLVSSSYPIGLVGAPTFTANSGYASFSDTVYLDPGFNPTTAVSPNFVQNSASMGAYTSGDAQSGAIIAFNATGAGVSYVAPRYGAGNTFYGIINAATDVDPGINIPAARGLSATSRLSASSYSNYKNGVKLYSQASTSAAPFNGNLTIGGGHSVQSTWPYNVACSFFGGGLTDNQMRALYQRIYIYMVTIAGVA